MTDALPQARLARISLGKLRAHPRNPRLDLGDLSELAASIREFGLQQPLEVQRIGGGYFGILDGHRRFGACVLAGLRTADALVVPERSTAQVVTTMLATGVHSKPLTPQERQRAVLLLLDEEHLSVSQVAAQCGVTPATIRRWRDGGRTLAAAPSERVGVRPYRRATRAAPLIGSRRITDLADRWTGRVGEHGLAPDDAHQFLAELRALTETRGTTP